MAQAGFILTRHWRDTPQGTEVSFWLATDNGPLLVFLAPQESVAFIPADQVPRAQHILQGEQGFPLTPLALKDFHRQPVYVLYCRAHRQLMNYEKRLREGGVTVYEADVRPPERYLMERFSTSPVWVEGDMRNGAIVNARLKTHPDYRPWQRTTGRCRLRLRRKSPWNLFPPIMFPALSIFCRVYKAVA